MGRGSRVAVVAAALASLASAPTLAATVRFTTQLRTGAAADVVVPILVDPTQGLSEIVASFTYDDTVLEPTEVFRTAVTADWSLAANLATAGTVSLTLDGGTVLSTNGPQEVAWVLFQVVGPAGSNSALEWIDAQLNAGEIAATTQNGVVMVVSASRVIAVPDDLQGQPGTPLIVPITATDVGGAESFDIILRYDTEVLDAVSVAKSTLTSSMTLTTFLGFPGEVRISLFTIHALAPGTGPVAHVTFDTVGAFGAATPLDLTKGIINESAITSTLDDGLLVLCDPLDGDFDGFSGCAGDCENAIAEVNPGAIEVCDDLDNDCDDLVDEGIVPPTAVAELHVERSGSDIVLEWDPVPEATGYDVVRGDLIALRNSDGEFSVAVEDCVADDLGATTVEDESPDGTALWYLVRPVNCGGGGSYDSADASLLESRDAEISAAAAACP